MKDTKNTNYGKDDRHYLSDFLEYINTKKKEKRNAIINTCQIDKTHEIPPFRG